LGIGVEEMSRMLHILFVTGEYPPMAGGVGAYTKALAQALVPLGARVSVLTSKAAGPPRTEDGVTIYARHGRWGRRAMRQAVVLAREIGADWIHVQYQTAAFRMNPSINMAPDFWRRNGLSTAWTYHDLRYPYLLPKIGDRIRILINLMPVKSSDLLIFTNEPDRDIVELERSDAVSIPIGSNIPARTVTPAQRTARRQARGYSPQDLVIGYFGFLNRSKGGLTLIRTLHILRQSGLPARLLMIGDRVGASDPTNHAYLQEVETLAQTLGVVDHMQWTGFLPDAEVSADLAACDVMLLPFTDGASLRRGSLMAALAQGCPIVTTTLAEGTTELVDGRDLLCVPVNDAEAAAQAVARIAQDPTLAHSLGHHARQASGQFSWENIAQQHLALYLHKGKSGNG
ncbi:MAG: glycosyltransferase family 4 protein, partial [Caldilineaceae bacterium]|nr:glycosyltransferase family 4 protein [Caldilineaceae bacterium]